MLTEKQLHNRLNKYYKKHYGEKDTDEWFVNPKDNVWKFIRDGKTIILECNKLTGEVSQKHERSS
jgi:hypothetical protein